MYAVVKIGGNQYKVGPGDKIRVDRLDGELGAKIEFPALLFVEDNRVLVGREAASVKVLAEIAGHLKGDKIDVFRFRHKTRHRRHIGFRPEITELKIVSMGADTKPVSTEKPAAKPRRKTVAKK